MTTRPGATLAELVMVTWLFALVLLGLARFAGAQGRLAAAVSDRVRLEELVRTTRLVLDRELRYLAAADVHALGPDSLRFRAVRGTGAVCHRGARHLVVRYRGVRWPDPAKDSVLLVTEGGRSGAGYAVTSVSSSAVCPGGLRLDLDRDLDPGPAGGVALVFESGAYHLSAGALRYRLGRGGRQPLTEAVLRGGRITPTGPFPGAPLRVVLSLRADSLPRIAPRDHWITLAPAPPPASGAAGAGVP